MIIPEGMTLRLDARDEYQHEPEAASNYNESMYFDMFDAARGIGAWFRIGNRPNEGHAEMTVCIHLPDGRVAFWFSRPEITDNAALDAGGFKVEVIEPFRRLALSYDGPVLLLDDPARLTDARSAFRDTPRTEASFRLSLEGVSPMHGGEIVNADGSRWDLDPETAAYRGHTEQHIAATGRIIIGDDAFAFEGYGFRDKSWGPRHWGNLFWHKWIPVTFGPDFGVMLALMGRPDQPPQVVGHVWRGDQLQPLRDARLHTEYDAAGIQRALTLELTTDQGVTSLVGECLSYTPLQHRRTAPDGQEVRVRIIKSVTRFQSEGREALGMAEYLDLMRDGIAVSRVEGSRFDG
jgi:hypothetical protein